MNDYLKLPEEEMRYGEISDDLYASKQARGSYHPLQFVVRLTPELKAALDASEFGVIQAKRVKKKAISAFSTYFHETVHWWQHIDSTTGLMLSFAYPAQFHVNLDNLRKSLNDFGPKKSIRSYLSKNYDRLVDEPRQNLNRIVNNWHDVEFNRRLIMDPLKAKSVVNSPFFECVGHSLQLGLSHTLWLLAASFDRDLKFLPDARQWEAGFRDLRERKVNDFHYGSSPIHLVPLGALKIFEGQARFCQLQYLHLASGEQLSWSDFDKMGMLKSPYIDAFNRFLEWSEIDFPSSVTHASVYLFLLLCDLAINPSDGYPFQLLHYESFVVSDDPGKRFYVFCRHIAKNPSLKFVIKKCSRQEYVEMASVLCKAIVCQTPLDIALQIAHWANTQLSLKKLLEEDRNFEFINENLPVRVCFARHIRFMQDKAVKPEFFCWPAKYFVETSQHSIDLNETMKLWKEHEPIFAAEMGGEVRPTLLPNRDASKIQRTFNEFYRWNILYDLVRQWTVSDGRFNYDYQWLTPTFTEDIIKPFADDMFKNAFSISPDDFGNVA